MAGLMIFAAGAVSGVLAGCVVRNRGVICKALELPDAIKTRVSGICKFGQVQRDRLLGKYKTAAATAEQNSP